MTPKQRKEIEFQAKIREVETLKSSGVKCSRRVLDSLGWSFFNENKKVLNEGAREMKVLRLKKFYRMRGWNFPPRIAEPYTADLINNYYGKHLVDYK